MNSNSSQPLAVTDGKTYIELEHAIGLNIPCYNPVYYLKKSTENAQNNEQKINDNDNNSNIDYLQVCGSSIVLSSFYDPHTQLFLRGHSSRISCCCVSPNKHLIASSQSGSTPDIYVWSVSDNKLLYKLEEHNKCVYRMSFSDDSRFLATVGTANDKMYIWDMNSGYIVTSSIIKPSPCNDIAWGGRVKDIKRRLTTDYLFATCGEEEVRIWAMTPSSGKLLSEKCKTSNLHSRRTFTCLAFSDTADLLIAGTTTGDFFVFDVKRLTALTSYQPNCVGGINCILSCKLRSNQDGDEVYIHDPLSGHYFIKILLGCGDGTISIWEYNDDLEQFIEENKISINDGGIQSMDMNQNEDKLLVATTRGNIHEIDINKYSKTSNPQKSNVLAPNQADPHQEKAKAKVISYNETSSIIGIKFPVNVSDSFITCTESGSIRKWSINDYSISLRHDGVNDNNNNKALCFDFNDEVIITGWLDGTIRAFNSNVSNDGMLWHIKDAHCSGNGGNGGVSCLRLGYNEKYIISAGINGTLRVWDIRFRNLVSHLKEHTGTINAIELYSDSRHVLTCSKDRSFICWDFQTQKRISCHRQNMGTINDIKLNKNQDIVMTVGGDQCITFWDIRQTKPIQSIKNAHNSDINCIQLSNQADSSLIATADSQSILKLWDIKTFKLISQQATHSGIINDIAFTHDDKQIVSVAQDSTIMLWNIFQM